jgi:hypothetical protein
MPSSAHLPFTSSSIERDQEMFDSPGSPMRPTLPSTVASFALPQSTSAPASPSSYHMSLDEPLTFMSATASPPGHIPLLRKIRRPSLLSTGGSRLGLLNDTLLSWKDKPPPSPLAPAPTLFSYETTSSNSSSKMLEDDDLGPAPLMLVDESRSRPQTPVTPPPRFPPLSVEGDYPQSARKYPPKPPRLLKLLSEASPQESEVDSEAKFQRFVASHASELPLNPRKPRQRQQRGRFPEEVVDDEDETRDEDDGSEDEEAGTEIESQDITPLTEEVIGGRSSSSSFGSPAGSMDVDSLVMHYSPPVSVSSTPNGWRATPPPSGTGRVGKRKHEDRYDPYPSAKRRAVSPSVHQNHSHVSPISIPRSRSPITYSRPVSATSSPVLRPVPRFGVGGNVREVQGAGDGLGCLKLK